VYPFESRLAWVLSSRAGHLVKGFALRPIPDSLVQERLDALRRWNRLYAGVTALLYLGAIAAGASLLARYLPALSDAAGALTSAATIAGAFAGVLTVLYILLGRLLGQIEADILTLVLGGEGRRGAPKREN